MSFRRPRVLRQLWLFLTCAVIWLSAGSAHAQRASQDTIVLVASAASEIERPALRHETPAKAAHVAQTPARAATWLVRRVEPNHAARHVVFVRDRYLHHCALLL